MGKKKSINNIIQQNGLFFILNEKNKTCSLSNTSGKNDHIFIPRSINYKDQEYIVTSITKINQDFTPKVKSIQFPSDSEVRTIKPMALAFSFLESLEIPASITEFKDDWLFGAKYLTQIKVAPNNRHFMYVDNKFLVGKSDKNSDNYDILLFVRRDIKNFIIPSMIKQIGNFSFSESSIESIEIPSHIERIHSSAFSHCQFLQTVHIPIDTKLRIIEEGVFESCLINKIFIPPQITRISDGAFFTSLFPIQVEFSPDSQIEELGKNCFGESAIQSFCLPPSVKYLRDGSFADCVDLESFQIPADSKLEIIERYTFSCTQIKSLTIPANVKELGECWCENTKNLTKVTIDPSNKVYTNYDDDGKVVIGKSDIESDVHDILIFVSRDIERFTIPSFITNINSNAFNDCLIQSIIIPSNVKFIGNGAFSCCDFLKKIEFDPDSELQVIGKEAFNCCPIGSFIIPRNVTSIEEGIFADCRYFQIIEIEDNSKLSLDELYNALNFGVPINVFIQIPVNLRNNLTNKISQQNP